MEAFLADIGLEHTETKEKLTESHINLRILKEMDHKDLKDIGIKGYGLRHKLLKGLKNLKQG